MSREDPFLETERLVLRRFTPADGPLLFELDSDPAVREFVHAAEPALELIEGTVLPRFQAYYDTYPHFGFWAAEEKTAAGREFAGWFHLRPEGGLEPTGEVELGYRLRRSAWGRGLASEGARALVAKGFEEGVPRVDAVTLITNVRSQRVLEKLGFERVEEFVYPPESHPGAAVPADPEQRRCYRYRLTAGGGAPAGD